MPGNRALASASVSIMRAGAQRRQAEPGQFGVQEAEVERRVVGDQLAVAEEPQQVVGDRGETRLAGHVAGGDAVDAGDLLRDVALGVDQGMEMPTGRQVVDQLQRGDLDHPVALHPFQAGGFRVEQDGPGHARNSLIRRRKVRRA